MTKKTGMLLRNQLKRRYFRLLVSLCLGFWLITFEAHAVVDANSRANTSAPSDGAPWDNVGEINGASGVYLGNGWVLTAAHVGVGSINLGGVNFDSDGTSVRLTNSDGSVTDLSMFRLVKAPSLPSLSLSSATPAALAQIDMIGFGYIAGSAQTNFGLYSGFYWSANGVKSWGNNKVNVGGTTTIDIGSGSLTTFVCDFTAPGTLGPTSQTSDEGQVAAGDSGGGIFQKNGSVWELAGILDAEQTVVNQPASTAAFGDKTYMADIATYRSEILAVMTAGPVPNLSITLSGKEALVCWLDNGVSYTFQMAASLDQKSWSGLDQEPFPTNGMMCVQVPASSGFQFFRLRKP